MAGYIKWVNRAASTAFAPDGAYIAAGTMAGAVDLQFSSSANLDIFELDFVSDDRQLIPVGTVPSSERFNRLSWEKGSANSEEYSLGLIAGGLVDGNIGIWNPRLLISNSSDTSENPFVANLSRHRGPVRGLEFSSLSPNLLASGADEGDICIWDLSKPSEPSHFPPLKGSGSATQGEISYLSWNSKVQHILSSTSTNGTTVVWDLKKQKPVISFSDSVRRRCSVLQWNPDIATQLIVASDEDSSPALRLWDMRNVMSPVKEFVGHTKGVIAMAWCPMDSSYLLTCAKDNRTICWDTATGEIVGELPAGTNWNFDLHWYSKIPGVISASSFDGKVGIYNIEGSGRYGVEGVDFGAAHLKKAPKWYKQKGGVSFGFGGKLLSFHSLESPAGSSEVYVHNLVTEHGLVSRSSEFVNAIQNGDRSALKLLCDRKYQESESEEERETWGFMKVMFNEDGTARSKLLSHLGFSLPAEESSTSQNDVSEQLNSLALDEDTNVKQGVSGYDASALFATDNGEDFFNNLPSPTADATSSKTKYEAGVGDIVYESKEIDGQEENFDPSFDDAVQHALVVGDYKGAVTQCISANRFADALVIAHVGGSSLWEHTHDQFLKTSRSPYLKVVSAMVNNDLMSIANIRPLKSWKETLALFCTFAQADDWTALCDTLATRLAVAGDITAATFCYICAGNIDKTIGIWSKSMSTKHEGKHYVDRLQDLMEKTIVFALATGQKRFSASLCKLVEKYAEILASQGLLTTAMDYLNLLGTEELSTELTILRDRITCSTEPAKEIEKTVPYENNQLQSGPAYVDQSSYGVVDTSQRYFPDATGSQMPQPVPSSLYHPYGEHYQQPPGVSFGKTYPPTYQPVPEPNTSQPSIFVPSPATSAPPGNFPPPPVNIQPAANFVPANPPLLKNVEQYQQPSTLGSQLYPGATSASYQTGPLGVPTYTSHVGRPGQSIPQFLAPTPPARGFLPMSGSGFQRPGVNLVQPSSPSQPATVQQPVAPATSPPTVQTVDTSNVPAHQKPVVATLTRLFNETSEALGGSRANPARKREIEDNSKKLGALFAKLNSGDISKNAAEKLVELCQAVDRGDFGTALQIQVLLTTSDWDECNFWLATLKRMIKTRQNLR